MRSSGYEPDENGHFSTPQSSLITHDADPAETVALGRSDRSPLALTVRSRREIALGKTLKSSEEFCD